MIDQAIAVYKNLQDEESRKIFEKRLMYSISGDEAYLTEMLHDLIESYAFEDSVYRLLQWLDNKRDKRVVIFGAGCASRHLQWILNTYNRKVEFICDNNEKLHGKMKYGILVISPKQLEIMKHEVCVICGVNWYSMEICRQLKQMGIADGDIFATSHGWWLGKAKQYFDSNIMQIGTSETFVDGGAYVGEDTAEFFRWCGEIEAKAYLFEPDRRNYQKCMENLKTYKDQIEICPRAIWSQPTNLFFFDGKDANSHIGTKGNVTVETIVLDEYLNNIPISFIKMDIEGAELEALKGAEKTIRKYKPRLAVCLYHNPADILEIPAYIQELGMNYRFYIRHYSYTPSETVLYAI